MRGIRTLEFEGEVTLLGNDGRTITTSATSRLNKHHRNSIHKRVNELCEALNELMRWEDCQGKAVCSKDERFDAYKGKDISTLRYRAKSQFKAGRKAMRASDIAYELAGLLEAVGTECEKNGLIALVDAKVRDE